MMITRNRCTALGAALDVLSGRLIKEKGGQHEDTKLVLEACRVLYGLGDGRLISTPNPAGPHLLAAIGDAEKLRTAYQGVYRGDQKIDWQTLDVTTDAFDWLDGALSMMEQGVKEPA